jgi:hypothetical protein
MAHALRKRRYRPRGSMLKNDLPIAMPCHADWQKMTPKDGGRFCGDCKKVVRDLSKMSEADAKALLRRPPNEGLCVRYLYDRHGKIFFGGERAGSSRSGLVPATLLSRAKRTALAAAAVALPLSLAACSSSPLDMFDSKSHELENEELTPNMGGVSMDESQEQARASDAGADADASDAHDGDAEATDGGERDAAPEKDAGVIIP